MYTAQRWTGTIAFFYMVWHTWHLRFTGVHLLAHPAAAFGKVQAEFQSPWAVAFYAVGIVCASWHFAYGLWLFAAKWGITTGDGARQQIWICVRCDRVVIRFGGRSHYVFILKHARCSRWTRLAREWNRSSYVRSLIRA